ncbi:alpha/beta fold hydrolase [Nocardioides sp. zg-1228]|uniref:alpha/beta fold hydrolase n=1 Tax=Nocardioides sp. zg-1228 TaxID=2763008 RepID=UPI00164327E4|nr:alpha/beta fold hydrolase [Nocardioides sp. zg-1228]MBC2933970.1 alpha/beta fold hydrolase [Nocardioides sp. zg-1228]QSF58729.1 alpha/beta fold hydrolase [Nocardioides sp. zg-1228]
MDPRPDPGAWRRRTVRGDGVDLAVLEAGDPEAPALVLVHGWPDTHRVWLPVAQRLAADLRVVVYDTRGQGLSPTDAPDSAFALPHLAADLMAVLDDVDPAHPVHVAGHDWGSVQAWEAVCEPGATDRIASFTSISGPNLDHVGAWARSTLRHPTPAGVAGLLGQAVSSSYVPFLVSPLAPAVLRVLGHRDMVSGLRYYRGNVGRPARGPRPRRTSVPVLQLALDRDPAIREAALVASEPWCDDLRRHHLPLGHWALRTDPDAVAEAVLGHVSAVEARRPATDA